MERYLAGTLSRSELSELLDYFGADHEKDLLTDHIRLAMLDDVTVDNPGLLDDISSRVQHRLDDIIVPKSVVRKLIPYSVAASILVAVCLGGYFLVHDKKEPQAEKRVASTEAEIRPGGNRAVLTLGNGEQIVIDGAANGQLASESGTSISKTEDGEIVYEPAGASAEDAQRITYNVIEIPKGGQYKLVLSDGSAVWLNAGSSLRYPTRFAGNERLVELQGEAYFEVAKSRQMPFVVKHGDARVLVLGTHFNVSGYADDALKKITLLEGSVKVSRANRADNQALVPGEQAQIAGDGEIKLLKDVDLEAVMAWKNGLFEFNGNSIQEVMKLVSRWYDVDVEYKGQVSHKFYGNISRDADIHELLKLLEMTKGVKFIVEPQKKKITVMPYQ